jgi:hypothetical protein
MFGAAHHLHARWFQLVRGFEQPAGSRQLTGVGKYRGRLGFSGLQAGCSRHCGIPPLAMLPPSAEPGLAYWAVVFSESAVSRALPLTKPNIWKTRNWLWGRSFAESSDLPARLCCWTTNVWWFGGLSNHAANRKTRNLLWGRSFAESSDSGGRRQFGPRIGRFGKRAALQQVPSFPMFTPAGM